jgi:ABC-type sugar transport system substrate-binding protein
MATRQCTVTAHLAAALAALLLGGCGQPADAPAPANSQGAPAPAQGSPKPKIAGIVFQEDQFMRLVELGMKDAGASAGAELFLGNSFGAQDKEFSLIDTYISRKVDAICVAPLSAKASIPALQRAHDAGIKVVTFDGSIDADFPVANIKSDQVQLGASTGEAARKYVETVLKGGANIAMIEYIALSPEIGGMRVKGFKQEITKLPGAKIVAEQDAWLAPAAADVTDSLLTAHPEINMIWAANEGGTVGAVRAIRNAGKAGKVVVFGTDMSVEIADLLLADDSILQAVTGQKPFDIGRMAVETAAKALKGEPAEKKVELPGVLFTREKPDEVRKYREYLEGLAK